MFKSKRIDLIIKGIIVLLCFYYSAYLQFIPIYLFKLDINNISASNKVLLSCFSSFCIMIIYIIIYFKDLVVEFKKFKNNLLENLDTGIKCWIIGLFIMMVSNVIITYLFKAGGANNQKIVESMIKAFPLFMLIDAGVLAPFNEEIVFRKTLKDVIKSPIIFALLSFILFGGAHVIGNVNQITDYLYIIPYGALGASFAIAYYKTDTVFTSMSLHMIHNIILVLISILALG